MIFSVGGRTRPQVNSNIVDSSLDNPFKIILSIILDFYRGSFFVKTINSSASIRGVSSGVEMIRMSRIPASISVESG